MSLPGLLVLDRDGVLFRHVDPYILSPGDVEELPGAREVVRAALGLGVPVASPSSPISPRSAAA